MSWILKQIESFLFERNLTKDGQAYGFLPLTGPALPVILIDVAYAAFVLKIGPKFMESRKPYEIKSVLKWYNTLQIVSNLYLSIMSIYHMLAEEDIEFGCILQLPANHSRKYWEVHFYYWGYMNKFFDYFDTILFVLRKSYRQVSFLHIYHHVMMTTCGYVYTRYYGFGGHAAFVGVLNGIVHTFMYSYYLIAAVRPDMKQSVWWKRYITKLQLAQFLLMLIHQSWPLIFRPDCEFPKIWLYLTIFQAALMLVMFGHFYRRTYLRKTNKSSSDMIGISARNQSEALKKIE